MQSGPSDFLTPVSTRADAPRTIRPPVEVRHAYGNANGTNAWEFRGADFSDDGSRLLIPFARDVGRPPRAYVHDFREGWTRAITPEGLTGPVVLSPDGRFVASNEAAGLFIYSVDGGSRREVPGGSDPGALARWSTDGNVVYLFEQNGAAAKLVRRNIETGERAVLREIRASDPAGITRFDPWIARDGNAYAYTQDRVLTNVFVSEGLK